MFDADTFPIKVDTEVELTLVDRTTMRGRFFVARGQRVADILNDSRTFLPFADISGAVRLVHKSAIVQVKTGATERRRARKRRRVGRDLTRGGA